MTRVQNKHLVKLFGLPDIIISRYHNLYGEPGKKQYLEEMYDGLDNILKMIKIKTGERHKLMLKDDAIYINGTKIFYFVKKVVNNSNGYYVVKYEYKRNMSYVKTLLNPIKDEVIMLYYLTDEKI